jgi:3-deoxy-manno-octulosonate cytidylyltransferase (CMP-KDO synthetase)
MNKKKILALIPARMGSSRFPGKPMKKINGKPMIQHVYERVSKNSQITSTYVATCDSEISTYLNKLGAKFMMTSKKHERASDRCAEALKKIEKIEKKSFDIVIMIEGDEPMVHPQMITEALAPFAKDKEISVVNLLGKFDSKKEYLDKNCIKVICDQEMNAKYFTRMLPIQFYNSKNRLLGKQVCIIPFKKEALIKYIKLKPTYFEIRESVDMWRLLENNLKVKMIRTKFKSYAVDTKNDLKKVSKIMKSPSFS